MSFGVQRDRGDEAGSSGRRIVKAITAETWVSLVIVIALFAVFVYQMGLANMFKTMMGTAHDLILNTVLFLMGVIILAGAAASFGSPVRRSACYQPSRTSSRWVPNLLSRSDPGPSSW